MTDSIPGYGGDKAIIIEKSKRFFECIQFKEFGEAAQFHSEEDQKDADIPDMIERLFFVKPENLDIQNVDILFGEIDSSDVLGRVKTKCLAHVLNTQEEKQIDVMLYWKKENGNWYLKLKSSLQ